MEEFNLEKFKKGYKAVTRSGEVAVFDTTPSRGNEEIFAIVGKDLHIVTYYKDGQYFKEKASNLDLVGMQEKAESSHK